MQHYMVERYLPGLDQRELASVRERLAAAADELTADGSTVRYLGSTFVPGEESCFCRFEGESAAAVQRVSERAGVPYARIHEVRDLARDNGGPGGVDDG